MTAGAIYYTDNRLRDPILSICRDQFLRSFKGEIVSVSMKPIEVGRNYVFEGEPGYPSMIRQILLALQKCTADYIFFVEHDVLYHPSHFEFVPKRQDTFYYNKNSMRWDYPNDRVIHYAELLSLSQLCSDHLLALEHYQARVQKMEELGLDKLKSKDPAWARAWGYEPGTKKRANGGFRDNKFDTWRSRFPNIDIRHSATFSPPKVHVEKFKHRPTDWNERTLDQVPGWNLKRMFYDT